jgi:hypothetical protein
MEYVSILVFFVYCWGLGYSVTYLAGVRKFDVEHQLMNLGIGLGALGILMVILNLFRIPLDWRIILVLSMLLPIATLGNKLPKMVGHLKKNFKGLDSSHNISLLLVLIMVAVSFYMFHKGAFSYPYLEDDDPWGHSLGAKYIATEKTFNVPSEFSSIRRFFYYLDPYPPGYDGMFGMLLQVGSQTIWTFKFFNALIISFSLLFFFYLMRSLTGSDKRALVAAFVLFALPSFLTHFIWAHALVVTLFFPSVYCLEKIKENPRWWFVAGVVLAGLFVAQPDTGLKLAIMLLIYYVVNCVVKKDLRPKIVYAGILGAVLSFAWWWNRWIGMFKTHNAGVSVAGEGSSSFVQKILSTLNKILYPHSGTASREYVVKDFFFAPSQNLINNPIGWGPVIFILVLLAALFLVWRLYSVSSKHETAAVYSNFFLGVSILLAFFSLFSFLIFLPLLIIFVMAFIILLIYRSVLEVKDYYWRLVGLGWFLFAFLGVHSYQLPIGLIPFRFWMILAIPVAILSMDGFFYATNFFRGNGVRLVVGVVLAVLVIYTSFFPKYQINTSMWGPGGSYSSMDEVKGYLWLDTLPKDAKVFGYFNNDFIIAYDKFTCYWCVDEYGFKKGLKNHSAEDISDFLKSKDYEYFIIDGAFARERGLNETNVLISELGGSGFMPVYQTSSFIAFRVA